MSATLHRAAAVFVTSDLTRALAHYERLGFVVSTTAADEYGVARRDAVEIHVARVEALDCRTTTSCVYLWVDDAGALYDEWAAAQVEGRLVRPGPTSYGIDEGAHVDPDGNLVRFGSAAPPVAAGH